ncbi:MAG: thiamine-phosphate kinase [Vulcanimicrobiaceae bacterium]
MSAGKGAARVREDDVVALIRRLAPAAKRVLLGIGDDAAVWQPSRSHRSLITTDALVEGVHFTRELSLHDIGFRAMAANISDLAAMGARPVLATVALGLREGTTLDEIEELYRGIVACASETGMAIAGGDLTRAPALTIAIAAVGEAAASRVKTRSGARRGDVIATTGELGESRAGLDALRNPGSLRGEIAAKAAAAFARPAVRWREALFLSSSRHVHAMMDCSDGLSTDLQRMCEASGLGAQIETVPAGAAASAMAAHLGTDAGAYALAGGEDFELIVAIAPHAYPHLAARFRARFGRPLERIGVMREQGGIVWRRDGKEEMIASTGWDHFA